MAKRGSTTTKASKTNTCSISDALEKKLEQHKNEKEKEWNEKDPNSFPPENFDPFSEADIVAYWETIPNFRIRNHWLSKLRYGLVRYAGNWPTRLVCYETGEVKPEDLPEDCFDPVDWNELQPIYDRKKAHLVSIGQDNPAQKNVDYSQHGIHDAYRRRKEYERHQEKVADLEKWQPSWKR